MSPAPCKAQKLVVLNNKVHTKAYVFLRASILEFSIAGPGGRHVDREQDVSPRVARQPQQQIQPSTFEPNVKLIPWPAEARTSNRKKNNFQDHGSSNLEQTIENNSTGAGSNREPFEQLFCFPEYIVSCQQTDLSRSNK